MDILNKTFAQLNDLFRSMTPGARITAGLLLVAIVVSLAWLFNGTVSGTDAYLLGGQAFSSSEISAMEAAFGQAGLSSYQVEGNRLRIPHGQQAAYMAALAEHGALPAHFGSILTKAVEENSPWMSRQQQEARLKVAKENELALIIRSMRGIESAAVQYDVQKKPGFVRDTVVTASVSVKPLGNMPLDERLVPMIRHLVAGAIAGLQAEQVTVIDLNGRHYSAGSDPLIAGAGSMDDPYLLAMKNYQASFEQSVAKALSYVPGATITANVELDRELFHNSQRVQVDPKSVAISTSEDTRSSSQETPGPGGRPGLESQQRPNQPANLMVSGRGTRSNEESSSSTIQSITSHETIETRLAGLTPKRVTVSIGIPDTYFMHIWEQRNPPQPGQPPAQPDRAALDAIAAEETTKIRAHVAALIPRTDLTIDPTSLVTVTTFAALPPASLPGPSVLSQLVEWLSQSWAMLGMFGLAIVSLLMLRAMVRSAATTNPEPASMAAEPTLAAETVGTDDEQDAATAPKPRTLKRKLGSGASLRDELIDMVREDPDAAANILRGWIGQAS